jgi:hypothetical protein
MGLRVERTVNDYGEYDDGIDKNVRMALDPLSSFFSWLFVNLFFLS